MIGALLLVAAVTPGVNAPTLTARVNPAEVTVGDRVEVELEIRLPPGTEAPAATHVPTLPPGMRRWGNAEVLAASAAQQLPGSEAAPRFRFHLLLTAFRPGEVALPPIPISVPAAARDDGRPEASPLVLHTPEGLGFAVRSVLPPGQPTPQPPAPPRALPVGAAFWWTTGALGLAALLAFAALLLQRRHLPAVAAVSDPAVPPLAGLLRELAALRIEPSAERLHTGLSLALRRFLAALLGYPAAERTTSEIDRRLRSERLELETRRGLLDLLRRCDEVKFARRPATREEGRARLEAAERIAVSVEVELRPPAPLASAPLVSAPPVSAPPERRGAA